MNDRIEIRQGDITTIAVDGIVNAANPQLAGGGGVDGAIHQAAGSQLQAACRQLDGCPTGETRLTPAFNLPAKKVLHTVGPIWQGGNQNEPEQLASCYKTSLALAEKENLHTVSFPAISCGVYRYPHQAAADIALKETCAWLENHSLPHKVIFVLFEQSIAALYQISLPNDFPPKDVQAG